MVSLTVVVVDKFQMNGNGESLPLHFYPVVLQQEGKEQIIGLTDENGRLVIRDDVIMPGTKIVLVLPSVADFYRPIEKEIQLGTEPQAVKIEMMGIRI